VKNRHTVKPFVEELERRLTPATASTSTNWSGYDIVGAGTVTDVKGSWVVPQVITTGSPPSNSTAASWLGIDGDGSSSVEQIGTDSDMVNSQPSYYAWVEMYPATFYVIHGFPVQPGDTISAEVKAVGGGYYLLSLTDTPVGGGPAETVLGIGKNTNAQQVSAEWIVEVAPPPLTNFGTETFTGAQATITGQTGTEHTGPIDDPAWNANVNAITLISKKKGTTLASPGGLTDSGSTFTVTWQNYRGPIQLQQTTRSLQPDIVIISPADAPDPVESPPSLQASAAIVRSLSDLTFNATGIPVSRCTSAPFFTVAKVSQVGAPLAKPTVSDLHGQGMESAAVPEVESQEDCDPWLCPMPSAEMLPSPSVDARQATDMLFAKSAVLTNLGGQEGETANAIAPYASRLEMNGEPLGAAQSEVGPKQDMAPFNSSDRPINPLTFLLLAAVFHDGWPSSTSRRTGRSHCVLND
jgi:hypothetical protein